MLQENDAFASHFGITQVSPMTEVRGEKSLQAPWPGKMKKRFLPFLNEPHLSPFFFLGNYISKSVLCNFDRELHHFLVQPCGEILETSIDHFPNSSSDLKTLSLLAADV